MFNEEMTSKMQPLQVNTPLPRGPGAEVELFGRFVKKKKMADISLVSRVRTTAATTITDKSSWEGCTT